MGSCHFKPDVEVRVVGLLAMLLFLNVFDLLLTVHGLHRGYLAEANPLMAWVYESYGYGGLAAAKAIFVGIGTFSGWYGRFYRWMVPALTGLCWIYMLVCAWGLALNLRGALS